MLRIAEVAKGFPGCNEESIVAQEHSMEAIEELFCMVVVANERDTQNQLPLVIADMAFVLAHISSEATV